MCRRTLPVWSTQPPLQRHGYTVIARCQAEWGQLILLQRSEANIDGVRGAKFRQANLAVDEGFHDQASFPLSLQGPLVIFSTQFGDAGTIQAANDNAFRDSVRIFIQLATARREGEQAAPSRPPFCSTRQPAFHTANHVHRNTVKRRHTVGQALLDDGLGHAVHDAGVGVLGNDEGALLLEQSAAYDAVCAPCRS